MKEYICTNLNEQGFDFLSDEEKLRVQFALRVTPAVCIALVLAGLYYQNSTLFFILTGFGVLGAATDRYQPIDFAYNSIAKVLGLPHIPPSPPQKRFACAIGAFFLFGAAVSLYLGASLLAYIFGGLYVAAAGLMALTHFCIASWLYNRIVHRKP